MNYLILKYSLFDDIEGEKFKDDLEYWAGFNFQMKLNNNAVYI